MKTKNKLNLFRWLASTSIAAGYALTSSLCYAQQATPAPSPAVAASADGKATTEQYFVLKNLAARIDELVAAKGA